MAAPPQQLDIFADSRDVMLRNDVLRALEQHDASAARTRWQALADAFPQDSFLPPLDVLTRALETRSSSPLPDHDSLAHERRLLAGDITSSARLAFGAAAAEAWLRPLWRGLTERGARLPFDAERADDHAAALYLLGGLWAEAAQAVESIESWRRIPAPLGWMTEALCRMERLDTCWALLAELAWLSPARLHALLRRLDDPLLKRLHKKFGATFEGSDDVADLAWFPAWVLIETPALAAHLALALPGQHSEAERAMRIVLELLGLERQGRQAELVQRRRMLRDLHAPLYRNYMATR
jgi:hypothetical protein